MISQTINAIAKIGHDATTAVPILVKKLKVHVEIIANLPRGAIEDVFTADSVFNNYKNPFAAFEALGSIDTVGNEVIPVLTDVMNEQKHAVLQLQAASALARIDPKNQTAWKRLVDSLRTKDE